MGRLLVVLWRVWLVHLRRVLLLISLIGRVLARRIGVLRRHVLVLAIIHAAPLHASKQNSDKGAHEEEELEDGLDAGEVVWLDGVFERETDIDDSECQVQGHPGNATAEEGEDRELSTSM